jgi:hypothetical protein
MRRLILLLSMIAVVLAAALASAAWAAEDGEGTTEPPDTGPPVVGQIDEDGGISPGDLGGLPGCGGFCMPSDPTDPGSGPRGPGDDGPTGPGGPGPQPPGDPEPDPQVPPSEGPDLGERYCLAELISVNELDDTFAIANVDGAVPTTIGELNGRGVKDSSLEAAFKAAHPRQPTSVCPKLGNGPEADAETMAKFDAAFDRLFRQGPPASGCSQFINVRTSSGTVRKPSFLEVGYKVTGRKANAPFEIRCYTFDTDVKAYKSIGQTL